MALARGGMALLPLVDWDDLVRSRRHAEEPAPRKSAGRKEQVERWNDASLDTMKRLHGSDFEVVEMGAIPVGG
jgi:hypothetical protein